MRLSMAAAVFARGVASGAWAAAQQQEAPRLPATCFGPGDPAFMINYRVRDLDRMLAQLRAAGVCVDPKVADEFNGRFGWVFDPEGNRIELWQPKAGY